MTKIELERTVLSKLLNDERILISNMTPDNDYGFVVTVRNNDSSHSLRRYQVMESINPFNEKIREIVEIDDVRWEETWNFTQEW